MKKYLSFISALMIGCITLVPMAKVYALGEPPKAVEVTPEDAAKKYPMPNGGKEYPAGLKPGTTALATGFVQSPFSSKVYDARGLKHGALILDESVKKVFRKP
jgi:hypothetical protein